MSAYNPPIEQLPIFDTNNFTNANEGNGALISEYLQFPIAQGLETFPNGAIVNNNLQNSYLSAIVGSGSFFIDGDTSGGNIYITAKTSTSKTFIQTENLGVATVCATFENNGITGNLTGTSSKLLLATKDDNVEYNVPFTSAVAGGGSDFFIDGGLNVKYNPSTNNLTVPNMIVSSNLQNSFLSALVGGGSMFIDSDTVSGDIIITNKTVASKTIIRTEGAGGALTNSAVFENGVITGNLNGTSSAITITSDNNTGTFYIPFTKTSGTGSKTLFIDDVTGPLTYNPVSQLITANINGTSALATQVTVSVLTTDANYYPTFVVNTGSRGIGIDNTTDNDYRYNPSTNTLTARNLLGNSLTSVVSTDLRIATTSTGNKINFNNTGTTGNICYIDSLGLTMATGKILTGDLTGTASNASAITITTDDTTGNYLIPFTKTSGTGSRTLFMDDTLPALTYSPNNNLLTVRNIEGTTFTAITDFDMTIATTTGAKKIYFNNTGTTGNICYIDSTGLTIASGKIITGNVTGNLTGNASKLLLTSTSSNTTYSLIFTDSGGGGVGSTCYLDSAYTLLYNPSTSILQAPNIATKSIVSYFNADFDIKSFGISNKINFYNGSVEGSNQLSLSISTTEIEAKNGAKFKGDLTGTSSQLQLTETEDNFSYSIPLTTGAGTGSATFYIDIGSNLTFNCSTNTLQVPKITCGSLTGSFHLNLYSATGYLCKFFNGENESMTISTTEIKPGTGVKFVGDLTGVSSLLQLTTTSLDVNYSIPLTNSNGVGVSGTFFIDGGANINYNPFTDTLNVPKISAGTITGTGGYLNLKGPADALIDFYIGTTLYMEISPTEIQTRGGTVFKGNLTGVASKSKLISKDDDVYYQVPFANWDTSLNTADWYADSNFKFNPLKNKLNISNINVDTLYTDTNMYFNVGLDGSSNEIRRVTIDALGVTLSNSGQFVGNLDGSAKTVNLNDFGDDLLCYPVFSKTTTVFSNPLFIDSVGTPFTYNPSTSTLTATNFSGTSSAITVTRDNTDTTCYIPFVKTGTTGSKSLFMDDATGPLSYNPLNSTLTATNFVGNFSVATSSTDATLYPTFIATGAGNRALLVDGDYGYNPNTNTLIVRNITGVSLSLTANSGNDLRLATTSTGNRINFNNTGTTGNICYVDSTGLTMATGKKFTGNLYGNVTGADLSITTNSGNDLNLATTSFGNRINFNSTGLTNNICIMDSNGITMATGKTITGTASTATNISGGSAGGLLYQSSTNVTAGMATGVLNQVVTSNGSSAPLWKTNLGVITGHTVNTGTSHTMTVATNAFKINIFTNYNLTITMPATADNFTTMMLSFKSTTSGTGTLDINNSAGVEIISYVLVGTSAYSLGFTFVYITDVSAWVQI